MEDKEKFLEGSVDFYLESARNARFSSKLSLICELGSAAATAAGIGAAINGDYIGVPVAIAGVGGMAGFHAVYKGDLQDALEAVDIADGYQQELDEFSEQSK